MSLTKTITEEVQAEVATGFANRNLVFERILASMAVELGLADDVTELADVDPAIVSQLWEAIDAAFAVHREEMRSWPDVTDCDRIRAAFDRLDRQGIVALEHCGATQEDGRRLAAEMAVVRDELGLVANDGYCFFHHQDTRRAIDGGGLRLAFGTFREPPTPHGAEVGDAVVRACHDAGLHVKWDGSLGRRIELPRFRWQCRAREIDEPEVAGFLESWALEICAGYTAIEERATLEARAEDWFCRFVDFGPELVNRLGARTEQLVELERARESTWAGPTTNDRISDAFAALRARGIHAAENAGLTIQDGWAYVGVSAAPDRRGAVFFHREDVIDGVAGRGLRLAFGALGDQATDDDHVGFALGEEIVSVLAEHGVPCSWGGSTGERIRIAPFAWRRRRWTAAPAYPPSPATPPRPRVPGKPPGRRSRIFGRGRPAEPAPGEAGSAAALRELGIVVRAVIDEGGFDLRRTRQMQAAWKKLGRTGDVHAGHLGTPHAFVPAGEHTTMRPQLADENLGDERWALIDRGRRARLAQPA